MSVYCLKNCFVILLAVLSHSVYGQKITATCKVASGSGTGLVEGVINLSQDSPRSNVTLRINLSGFNATGNTQHGFHVHKDDSLGHLCTDAGPHFNIENTLHGAPFDPRSKRHTGDLGNVEMDSKGTINDLVISDWLISLSGNNSVLGKPIVIHAWEDDLGRGGSPLSNTTGNAGARIGCCLIVQDPVSPPSLFSLGSWSEIRKAQVKTQRGRRVLMKQREDVRQNGLRAERIKARKEQQAERNPVY